MEHSRHLKRKALKSMMSGKMMDMGHKMETIEAIPSSKKAKSRIEYPTLHLYHKVPSWIMNKNLGSECKIIALGKVISKSIDESNTGRKENATIEIRKMGEE